MKALLAVIMVVLMINEANAGIFRRGCGNSCGGCSTSCGTGSSNGCKISSAPSRSAEPVDLFKEDNAKEEIPQAPPVSAKINYTKSSAIALTASPRRFDRASALALTAKPFMDVTNAKALLASK